MISCSKCSNQVVETSKYCGNCGATVVHNSSNSKSSKIAIAVAVVSLLIPSYGWATSYVASNERIESLNVQIASLDTKVAELDEKNTGLSADLSAAKSRLGEAEGEVEKQKSEASAQRQEANRQKAAAQQKDVVINQKNQELTVTNYYLNLAVELADVLETQKKLYNESGINVARSASALLKGDYNAVTYYLRKAQEQQAQADALEGRVQSIINQFM